jgi:uncharacterized protein (TIGR02449 family)
MENELLILEGKLEQLVGLVFRLRADNTSLNAQLEAVQTENRQIHEKMETARVRVAQLISVIPEDIDNTPDGESE